MKIKKIALIMVLVLCVSSASSAFAEERKYNDENTFSYQLRWANIASVDAFIEETS